MMKWTPCSTIALSFAVTCGAEIPLHAGDESPPAPIASDLGDQTGLVVHVGCGGGERTAALGANENRLVHALSVSGEDVKRARKHIRGLGLYGRVSVAQFDGKHLPYADGIVNLLVAEDLGPLRMDEVLRVLVPGGIVYTKSDDSWTKTRKPWSKEIDEWSHHLHGPDGNPVAQDSIVGPPRRLQWLSAPKWQRAHDTDANINALVSAGGRVFYLVDEAPIGLPGDNGLPDKWSLTARDAFNGILLWQIPVEKWGWREYKDTHYRTRHDIVPVNVHRRVVATADRVYATLGIGAPVSELDAATGKVLRQYAGTEGTREILFEAGQLILTLPGTSGLNIKVLSATTGDLVWTSSGEYRGTANETGKLKLVKQPVLNAAVDNKSICFMDDAEIICLDRLTGTQRWHSKPQMKGEDLWAGTLMIKQGVVLYAEHELLTALSVDDGAVLWSREAKQPGGLWFSWKDVFVIDDLVWTWGPATRRSASEIHGHDLKTGTVKKRMPLGHIFNVDHHHRCYRNKATSHYVIASRRGAEFIDLEGGRHSVNNWVRGICHLGMMPANGLLYAPPEPCKCYWYERISGFCALAPEPLDAATVPKSDYASQTIPGPAFGNAGGEPSAPEDWPTFRADPRRSGSTTSRLVGPLTSTWQAALEGPLSAPIAVGDKVVVAEVNAHTVHAFDAASGKERWHHTAGGRVDSPPTYAKGKIVFGSVDGWVTCLRASDGAVVWRFHAAPHQRLIGVHSQLESAWPVHGSVLVLDDTVYFAAGRSSYLDGGIHLYALGLDSGEVLHRAGLQGPDVDLSDESWFSNYNEVGGRGALADILQLSGDQVCMRNRVFNRELEPSDQPAPNHLQPMGGFLDDTYFKRYYWFYGTPMTRNVYAAMAKPQITEEQMAIALSQLLVQDDTALFGVRMFDSMKLLNANNYFVPGNEGYLVFKVAPGQGEPEWSERVPLRVTAMAATPGQLAISGPPDIVDPDDPLGAFEARKGGKLRLLSGENGETLEEHELPSPPVFNGLAVARGRLFLALQNGTLACLTATNHQ